LITILTDDFYNFLRRKLNDPLSSISLLAYVINFQFYKKFYRSTHIFNRIIELHKKGISVRIILDSSTQLAHNHRANLFAVKRLTEAGIPVRMQATPTPQHAKAILIDDKLLIAGSHNLTQGSMVNPFELSFAITDIPVVKGFASYYDQLYNSTLTRPWERKLWPKSKINQSPSTQTGTPPPRTPNPFRINIESP